MQQITIVVAQHLFPLCSICARLAQRQPARRRKGNNRSDCLSQHGTGRHDTGGRERKVRNADVSSCKGEIGNIAGIQTAPWNGIRRRNRVKDIWLFSATEAEGRVVIHCPAAIGCLIVKMSAFVDILLRKNIISEISPRFPFGGQRADEAKIPVFRIEYSAVFDVVPYTVYGSE